MSEAQLSAPAYPICRDRCSSNNHTGQRRGTPSTYKKVIPIHLLSICKVSRLPIQFSHLLTIKRLHSKPLSFLSFEQVIQEIRASFGSPPTTTALRITLPQSQPAFIHPTGPHGTNQKRHFLTPQSDEPEHTPDFSQKSGATYPFSAFSFHFPTFAQLFEPLSSDSISILTETNNR